ncbi:hypothetical protein HNR55_001305 [Acetobacter lovaniensis]|jgi:hypothetical protein|uniref:Uncharacterized protein n=1 Tax=Acetobacter lovaniensis TaxID=104100 RepID=A0A841QEM8_9PROT|nr:hypothetical protein [Acetobacter lovaniensis]
MRLYILNVIFETNLKTLILYSVYLIFPCMLIQLLKNELSFSLAYRKIYLTYPFPVYSNFKRCSITNHAFPVPALLSGMSVMGSTSLWFSLLPKD